VQAAAGPETQNRRYAVSSHMPYPPNLLSFPLQWPSMLHRPSPLKLIASLPLCRSLGSNTHSDQCCLWYSLCLEFFAVVA
jgi:hypothetical protein